MIYDCFPFFNELDILELRLNILYDYVDYFVIAEGNKTHTGIPKEFIFEKNKASFTKFLDKIKYIKVDNFPSLEESKESEDGNKWLYENYQRDAIMKGLTGCSDNDIIIISDCDEIPNPEAIKKYKKGVCSLVQYRFAYNYNTLYLHAPYSQSAKIVRYCNLVDPKQKVKPRHEKFCKYSKYGLPTYLRFLRGKKIKNGGWHFSYVGDVNFIKQKMNAIVEQQYNPTKWYNDKELADMINAQKDILRRGDEFVNLKIDKLYPKYFLDNLSKYEKHIFKDKNISLFKMKILFCCAKLNKCAKKIRSKICRKSV